MFDYPLVAYATLAGCGVLAGIINTIAGGGSFLTLPLLMGMGLPPSVANGTLRVGVALQNVTSLLTFHRRGVRDYGLSSRLLLPVCAGSVAGAWLATRLDDQVLKPIFGMVLLGWAIFLIFRPAGFLEPQGEPRQPGGRHLILAAVTGFYGGFLQAGVGFPLMALLVLGLGYSAVRANGIKVTLILCYTGLVLPIFALHQQIAWIEAFCLAAGTMLGGYLGTRWQLKAGAPLIRWFVIVMVTVSGAMMLF